MTIVPVGVSFTVCGGGSAKCDCSMAWLVNMYSKLLRCFTLGTPTKLELKYFKDRGNL